MTKPLVYIAGPYTLPDPVANTRRAVHFAERLFSEGKVTPVVPHLTMLWHFILPHSLEWWYRYDIELLAHCDALLRLPGESAGADREVAFARENLIPVFHSISVLNANITVVGDITTIINPE